MSHANALGDTGIITVAAGADLDLTANINVGRSLVLSAMSGPTKGGRLLSSSGANTYSGGITVNNSEFDVASGSTLDVTGKITGSGTVTKTGLGELLLNNNGNDYTGITDVQNGTLTASTIANSNTASTIGSGSELKVGSASTAGTFKYTGSSASMNRTVTVGSAGGTINVNDSGATMTLTGTVAGSGATLTKTGAGRLALGSGSAPP
jgi:autotransporter-associated beta strand protein